MPQRYLNTSCLSVLVVLIAAGHCHAQNAGRFCADTLDPLPPWGCGLIEAVTARLEQIRDSTLGYTIPNAHGTEGGCSVRVLSYATKAALMPRDSGQGKRDTIITHRALLWLHFQAEPDDDSVWHLARAYVDIVPGGLPRYRLPDLNRLFKERLDVPLRDAPARPVARAAQRDRRVPQRPKVRGKSRKEVMPSSQDTLIPSTAPMVATRVRVPAPRIEGASDVPLEMRVQRTENAGGARANNASEGTGVVRFAEGEPDKESSRLPLPEREPTPPADTLPAVRPPAHAGDAGLRSFDAAPDNAAVAQFVGGLSEQRGIPEIHPEFFFSPNSFGVFQGEWFVGGRVRGRTWLAVIGAPPVYDYSGGR